MDTQVQESPVGRAAKGIVTEKKAVRRLVSKIGKVVKPPPGKRKRKLKESPLRTQRRELRKLLNEELRRMASEEWFSTSSLITVFFFSRLGGIISMDETKM